MSIKKIVAYSLIFVLYTLSIFGSVVSVYADSVTSLPAHSDITSSFDANYIYLNTPSGDYTINRNTKLTGIYHSNNNNYYYPYYSATTCYYRGVTSGTSETMDNNFYLPVSFEMDNAGHLLDTCYWYSPSQNIVYILNSAYNPTLKSSTCHVLSYYSSSPSFYIDSDNMSGKYTCYFIHQLNLSTGVTSYGVGKSVSSSSRFSTSSLSYIYKSRTTDLSQDSNFGSKSFPSDLVCIYSSYTIEGFWEYDASSDIVTPDYYFNYQYLFEGVNNHIIFIDSSKPLVNFNLGTGDLKFSDLCNKRIYVTTDGQSWINLVSSSLMYSGIYSLDFKYFKDGDNISFRLVYSNDESYADEPLVKPEFNSHFTFYDVYSHLPTWIEQYHDGLSWSDAYYTVFPGKDTSSLTGLKALFYGGLSGANDALTFLGYSDDSVQDFINQIFDVDDISAADAFLANIFSNLTHQFNYQYDSNGNLISRTRTLYGYVQLLADNGYDIVQLLNLLRSDIINPLESLFDISSFNADRLVDITALIKGFKIPDYSKKLDSIIASLTSSSVPSFDDSGIIAAINNAAFDDSSILDAINNLSITSGGGSSPTVSVDLDKLYKLLDFDISDYDDDKTDDDTRVVDFVVDGLNDLVSGSVLQDALDFAPGVLSGIGLVNGFVVNIYDNLGNYKPVVLLGLTFTVVGTVIRKEEA